ncbi:hypothetical protein H6768_06820 [Candidatus Peribacteria bacterium]|nr:hypothetical protein [Candidatus Peribacteria bacterium]
MDNLNWLEKITFPHTCLAQIRYRQTPQICTLTSFTDKKILVNFKDPQRAITP